MITTLVNIALAGGLSVLAHYVNSIWTFLILGWIVGLVSIVVALSLIINGIRFLCFRKWLYATLNLIMLVPLIYFSIPMIQIIGG